MNAGLAKPIPAIWFIGTKAIDLHQADAAALFDDLPSWLRDHQSLPRSDEKYCDAQLENFNAQRPLRPASTASGVRLSVVSLASSPMNIGGSDAEAFADRIEFIGGIGQLRQHIRLPMTCVNPPQPFARASPASRTSILRKPTALVTRSGKSSRSVALPACISIPSGSQPVQRQSADSAPSSRVA
jgi:hypothetical protein